jgi:hypothetical protein
MNAEKVGIDSYVTLLDMAILADDVELTEKFLEEQAAGNAPTIDPDLLEYGDGYLENAVIVESLHVARWLLSRGFDPNQRNDVGATPLLVSQVRTEEGLRATRDLVKFGANLDERSTRFNLTPLMFARVNGDLRKVQCLLALGARMPKGEDYSKISIEQAKLEKVALVDEFLASSINQIPSGVSENCSLEDARPSEDRP